MTEAMLTTFKQDSIASVIHSVELSISREADGEIEMYLRSGFRNILKKQDFPQPLSSWPSDNDIQMLVDAADGLFAHPAAVLRVVAYPPDSQFRERLQSVLDSLAGAGKQESTFSQLDALYVHVMEQIPERNSCLHNSFFPMIWATGMPTVIGMFPCIAACLGSPSVCSETSVTIYMP